MADWTVRIARTADLGALAMLSAANRLYHAQVDDRVGGADLSGRQERYRALLAADNALVLLAETGASSSEPPGTPIGCFAAIFYPRRGDTEARAYVEDTFIVRRWRRRGITSAFLGELVSACRTRGIDRVDVDYLADNDGGAAAWGALGFAPRSVSATARLGNLKAGRQGSR